MYEYDFEDESDDGSVEWENKDVTPSQFVQDIWTGCFFDGNQPDHLKVYESETRNMRLAMQRQDAVLLKTASRVLSSQLDSPVDCVAYGLLTEDVVSFKSFPEFIVGCEKVYEEFYEGHDPASYIDEMILNVARCAMFNCWNLHSIHGIYDSRMHEVLWHYPEFARFGDFLTIYGFKPPPAGQLRQDKWVKRFTTRRRTQRIDL